MKPALFIFSLCFVFQIGYSQNKVSYAYDAAGNRTGRIIEKPSKSSAQSDEEKEITGVFSEVLADLRIHIYPNPTEGRIRVDIQNLPEGEKAVLNLYSTSGKLLISKKNVSSSTEINLSGQHKGTYILKIIAEKQQTEWKIIKK